MKLWYNWLMMLNKSKKNLPNIPSNSKNSKEMNSIIGPGSIFEGKFYISGNIQIDGKFEGEIKTEQSLIIGETGKVKTDLEANNVILAGTMIGNIIAQSEVRLEQTGRLMGDITTPVLKIQPGLVAQGHVTITGGQKKDVKKIVDESFGSSIHIPDKPGYLAPNTGRFSRNKGSLGSK